jgi:AAA domain
MSRPGVIPAARVTGLSGDGSAGKSLLSEQLGIAVASGTDWIGKLPRMGKCLFLTCEDDIDEVHRRLKDIIAGRGDINPDDLANFEVIDMVGEDALLASLDGRSGRLIPTEVYTAIVTRIEKFFDPYVKGSDQGRILILDTLAKVYGGDENIRLQVTQFVGFLDKIAIKYHVAIVLLLHPSLTGRNTGTGESGSTGWTGSMRASPKWRTMAVMSQWISPRLSSGFWTPARSGSKTTASQAIQSKGWFQQRNEHMGEAKRRRDRDSYSQAYKDGEAFAEIVAHALERSNDNQVVVGPLLHPPLGDDSTNGKDFFIIASSEAGRGFRSDGVIIGDSDGISYRKGSSPPLFATAQAAVSLSITQPMNSIWPSFAKRSGPAGASLAFASKSRPSEELPDMLEREHFNYGVYLPVFLGSMCPSRGKR